MRVSHVDALSVVVSLSLLYEVIRRSTGAGPGLIDKCGFH